MQRTKRKGSASVEPGRGHIEATNHARLAQTPRSKTIQVASKKNLGLLWILEIWISKTVTRYFSTTKTSKTIPSIGDLVSSHVGPAWQFR
jgi:hypothetical protein